MQTWCPRDYLHASAGVDQAQNDNKLKTKVRRLYDIANVLTSLNLIMKVNLSPSRKPGFQWLGVQGVCLHQGNQDASARHASVPEAVPASRENVSEAASSSATAAPQPRKQMQQAAHQVQSSRATPRSTSPAMSSKGQKRSAAYSQSAAVPHKRCKTRSEPLSAPPNLDTGTSAVQSADLLEHALSASAAEVCSAELDLAKPECSPGLPAERHARGANKAGLRPTPVPVTPEGALPEAQHLQRQEVSLIM